VQPGTSLTLQTGHIADRCLAYVVVLS